MILSFWIPLLLAIAIALVGMLVLVLVAPLIREHVRRGEYRDAWASALMGAIVLVALAALALPVCAAVFRNA